MNEDVWRRAVALAGALAEAAVADLVVVPVDGPSRRCVARETDLPGVLSAMRAGESLVVASIGLIVRRGAAGLEVESAATERARAIALAAGL